MGERPNTEFCIEKKKKKKKKWKKNEKKKPRPSKTTGLIFTFSIATSCPHPCERFSAAAGGRGCSWLVIGVYCHVNNSGHLRKVAGRWIQIHVSRMNKLCWIFPRISGKNKCFVHSLTMTGGWGWNCMYKALTWCTCIWKMSRMTIKHFHNDTIGNLDQ